VISVLAIVAILLCVIIYYAIRRTENAPESSTPEEAAPLAKTWEERRYPGSSAFDLKFERSIAQIADYYFQTSLVGTSDGSSDGTVRTEIIERCEPFDELQLVAEPNNPMDPKAIAVRTKDGTQLLGYLSKADAKQIHADSGEPFEWQAICKYANRDFETQRTVGASIVLVRLPEPPEPP
jgi:hypothetical protein